MFYFNSLLYILLRIPQNQSFKQFVSCALKRVQGKASLQRNTIKEDLEVTIVLYAFGGKVVWLIFRLPRRARMRDFDLRYACANIFCQHLRAKHHRLSFDIAKT